MNDNKDYPIFNGHLFHEWKTQMESILRCRGLWRIVSGEKKFPTRKTSIEKKVILNEEEIGDYSVGNIIIGIYYRTKNADG